MSYTFTDICNDIRASGKTFARDRKGSIREAATVTLVSVALYGETPWTALRQKEADFHAAHCLSLCEHGDEYLGNNGSLSAQFLQAVGIPPVKNMQLLFHKETTP